MPAGVPRPVEPLILLEGHGEHAVRRSLSPRSLPFTIKVGEEYGNAQDFFVVTEVMPRDTFSPDGSECVYQYSSTRQSEPYVLLEARR